MNTFYKKFDLNIGKVLENWEVYHAIREIISNGLDEKLLSNTKELEIWKDKNNKWHIKDFGRGLNYYNLIQNENPEKINSDKVIGKFGVGLKDAIATFDRHNIKVKIKSKFGIIAFGKDDKQHFNDVKTLHAYIYPFEDSSFIGTEFVLEGCSDRDMELAKELFLEFNNENVISENEYGQILEKKDHNAYIYINGVKVAEESNFTFSYNITSLTSKMKKALNRERSYVSRSAYSERIKSMLLKSSDKDIMDKLIENMDSDIKNDELNWKEVYLHVCKYMNTSENTIFVTQEQYHNSSDTIKVFVDNKALDNDKDMNVVVVPDKFYDAINNSTDFEDKPLETLDKIVEETCDGFEYDFVDLSDLSDEELKNKNFVEDLIRQFYPIPSNVKEIKISSKMPPSIFDNFMTYGQWLENEGVIIIHRGELNKASTYAETLLHELAHAKTGYNDSTRYFENELNYIIRALFGYLSNYVK